MGEIVMFPGTQRQQDDAGIGAWSTDDTRIRIRSGAGIALNTKKKMCDTDEDAQIHPGEFPDSA